MPNHLQLIVHTVGSLVYLQLLPPTTPLAWHNPPPPPPPPSYSFFISFALPTPPPLHLPPVPLRRWVFSSFSLHPSLFLSLSPAAPPCIIKFFVEVRPPSCSIFSSPFLSTSFCLSFFCSLVNNKKKVRVAWKYWRSLFFFFFFPPARPILLSDNLEMLNHTLSPPPSSSHPVKGLWFYFVLSSYPVVLINTQCGSSMSLCISLSALDRVMSGA